MIYLRIQQLDIYDILWALARTKESDKEMTDVCETAKQQQKRH